MTNSLYHYYALLTGRAVVPDRCHGSSTSRPRSRASLAGDGAAPASAATMDMFCLNDGSTPEISEELRVRAVTDFLERILPVPRAVGERDRGAAATNGNRPPLTGGAIRRRRAGIGMLHAGLGTRRAHPRLCPAAIDACSTASSRARVDRHHRVQHRVVVDVHEVERLRAVAAAGAADRHVEVLRVAGRRRDRDGDAGERRERASSAGARR